MKIIGALGGGGGKPSAFAAVSVGGASFETQFFGVGGNAKKIIYVVDASGSLIDTFPFVIMELKRSISELKDAQSFTVIFFQGEDHIEVPPPRLKKATSENKLKVIEWVDPASGNVIPTGLSNPVKAITRALQYQPELIFLLSDNIPNPGHYAFAMEPEQFARSFQRIKEAGIPYGDGPEIATNMRGPGKSTGTRGYTQSVYFNDPSGHLLEIITYP